MRLLPLLLVLAGCANKAPPIVAAGATLPTETLDIAGAVGPFAPASPPDLLPMGRWLRVGESIAFTYVDPVKGPSASWTDPDGTRHIRRLLWAPAAFEVLGDDAVAVLGLPPVPEWLEHYGSQPGRGELHGHWRDDPELAHRLHSSDYPDDMRVVVGREDGRYDLLWVRLRSCAATRCEANLLNAPTSLSLEVGGSVWFDMEGVEAARVPAAFPEGQPPFEKLITIAAAAPALDGVLQDRLDWTVDTSVPAEERLPWVGRWVAVGEEIAFVYLGWKGPTAAVVSRGDVSYEVIHWRTRGMRLLKDDELAKLGLDWTPDVQNAPEQPEPGLWGQWRVDPSSSWIFQGEDPDVASVMVAGPAGQELGSMRVLACDGPACSGRLLEDRAGLEHGAMVQLVTTRRPDFDVPLAWSVDLPTPPGLQ